jgi:hypothetical protein
MDAIANPYAAGAGLPPPELAGREAVQETVRVALERTRRGLPARSVLLVGLHGVGKTVLLDNLRSAAEAAGISTVPVQAREGQSLPSLLAPGLRLALLRLTRTENSKEDANRALSALAGFVTGLGHKYPDIEVGLDADPRPGLANSGDFAHDLHELFASVGAAARSADSAMGLFIDELHWVPPSELMVLAGALQRCAQQRLPVTLVGAGLPQVRGQAENTRSVVDRQLECRELGPLSPEAAARAISKPAAKLNVEFEDTAVANILAATQCYPYFLQEFGKQVWDSARHSPITLQDTRNASVSTLAALDENFFRAGLDRLTPPLKKYLRAMAELGAGPHRSGDIAAALDRPVTAVAPTRNQLIVKGVIWSPGRAQTAFAIPRVDEFLRRTWPDPSWRN